MSFFKTEFLSAKNECELYKLVSKWAYLLLFVLFFKQTSAFATNDSEMRQVGGNGWTNGLVSIDGGDISIVSREGCSKLICKGEIRCTGDLNIRALGCSLDLSQLAPKCRHIKIVLVSYEEAARLSAERRINEAVDRALRAQRSEYQSRIDLAERSARNARAEANRLMEEMRTANAARVNILKRMVREVCFGGNTPITLAVENPQCYASKRISEIKVGDSILSCNLSLTGGLLETSQVQELMIRTVNQWVQLTFNGKTLEVTENHPFYVESKEGWVEVKDLKIGDELRTLSGETVTIDAIQRQDGELVVYNLDVPENHNYYACEVLVHNCNAAGIPEPAGLNNF